ncbi:MAG: hypothetical protein Q8K92_08470 [Leadbetterella sp.]|nr:hypothetical protein [Leadbetterella sp.]
MIQEKAEIILDKVFNYKRLAMMEALGVKKSKLSYILQGQQQFTIEAIKILLTDYKIDPTWLWDDDPASEIRFQGEPIKEDKYYQAVEKINVLQEELLKYQKKDIDSLKNNSDVHV